MSDDTRADLGGLIADAADEQDAATAANIIRSGEFIVLQQIDPESGESQEIEEGDISVVLAEWEDETAVVCFSKMQFASDFTEEIAGEIPEGHDLPAVILDGDSLLDGLPEDCGLLLNPGAETECYFPPGSLEPEAES